MALCDNEQLLGLSFVGSRTVLPQHWTITGDVYLAWSEDECKILTSLIVFFFEMKAWQPYKRIHEFRNKVPFKQIFVEVILFSEFADSEIRITLTSRFHFEKPLLSAEFD